jgi:FAD synthase
LRIEFCTRLRDERRFDSIDQLKVQLALDRQKACEILVA